MLPGSPLGDLVESGEFVPLGEVDTVREIRRFLAGLDGVTTRIESDHLLNLLMDLRGEIPEKLPELLSICDEFLGLPEEDRTLFVLGRRFGVLTLFRQLDRPGVREQLCRLREAARADGIDPEDLRRRLI